MKHQAQITTQIVTGDVHGIILQMIQQADHILQQSLRVQLRPRIF